MLLESLRKSLAGTLLRHNTLSLPDLDKAVQITLDRLIFLRVCEDRGIEAYGELLELAKNSSDPSADLFKLFRRADDKYNSGLFHFKRENERRPRSIA